MRKVTLILLALITCAALAGCGETTAPDPVGVPETFPACARVDVNPNSGTAGQTVREDRLGGPASVVYFGWAT